ncbi:MAG TPA: hypothetical protein VL201_01735 [Patescibacteria group bacterium]|jgi:hypothetical protein|nr:hypothetical protein [Patescibacteria group bacterium]
MKLMNILLLCGLINNAYSIDAETLLEIKTIWNYFTPFAKRELKPILQNGDAYAYQKADPVLLLFILPKNEFDHHATEKQKIMVGMIGTLVAQGADQRPFIADILTDEGIHFLKNKIDNDACALCNEFQLLSQYFKTKDDQLFDAEELNKIFNDEDDTKKD